MLVDASSGERPVEAQPAPVRDRQGEALRPEPGGRERRLQRARERPCGRPRRPRHREADRAAPAGDPAGLSGRLPDGAVRRGAARARREVRSAAAAATGRASARSNDKFEALMAYYHIDRTRATSTASVHAATPTPRPHARRSSPTRSRADNSFYSPSDRQDPSTAPAASTTPRTPTWSSTSTATRSRTPGPRLRLPRSSSARPAARRGLRRLQVGDDTLDPARPPNYPSAGTASSTGTASRLRRAPGRTVRPASSTAATASRHAAAEANARDCGQ